MIHGRLLESSETAKPRPNYSEEKKKIMETSDIKKGVKIMQDGQPYVVVDFQFVKPGKGQAFTRTKMKNILTELLYSDASTCSLSNFKFFLQIKANRRVPTGFRSGPPIQ